MTSNKRHVQHHHAGSGSALVPPHACVMYCRERTSTRKTVETKMWNKCFFCFLCAFVYSRGFVKLQLTDWCYMDYLTNLLAMFLDMGTFQLCCCLWRVWKLSDSNQNILIYVPTMNGRSDGFGTTSGWVLNGIIFIFGWTNPLNIDNIIFVVVNVV